VTYRDFCFTVSPNAKNKNKKTTTKTTTTKNSAENSSINPCYLKIV